MLLQAVIDSYDFNNFTQDHPKIFALVSLQKLGKKNYPVNNFKNHVSAVPWVQPRNCFLAAKLFVTEQKYTDSRQINNSGTTVTKILQYQVTRLIHRFSQA